MTIVPEIKRKMLISLSDSASHGYQLHKELGITTATVYRHLEELEESGIIESETLEDDSRGKKMYSITEKGEELLEILDR